MSLATLVAPILAVFLVRQLLKAIGLGDIMKFSSAMTIPTAGAMKMGGGGGLAGKTFDKINNKWLGERDEKGRPKIDPKTGKNLGGVAGRISGGSKKAVKSASQKAFGAGSQMDIKYGTADRLANLKGSTGGDGADARTGMLGRAMNLHRLASSRAGTAIGREIAPEGTKRGKLFFAIAHRPSSISKAQKNKNQVDEYRERKEARSEARASGKNGGEKKTSNQILAERAAAKESVRAKSLTDHLINNNISGVAPDTFAQYMGSDGNLDFSHQAVKDMIAHDFSRSSGMKFDDILVSDNGTVLPNGKITEGNTAEGTAFIMSHPITHFPEHMKARRGGESNNDYTRRMISYGRELGLYNSETGQWADMLTMNGIYANKPRHMTEITAAAVAGSFEGFIANKVGPVNIDHGMEVRVGAIVRAAAVVERTLALENADRLRQSLNIDIDLTQELMKSLDNSIGANQRTVSGITVELDRKLIKNEEAKGEKSFNEYLDKIKIGTETALMEAVETKYNGKMQVLSTSYVTQVETAKSLGSTELINKALAEADARFAKDMKILAAEKTNSMEDLNVIVDELILNVEKGNDRGLQAAKNKTDALLRECKSSVASSTTEFFKMRSSFDDAAANANIHSKAALEQFNKGRAISSRTARIGTILNPTPVKQKTVDYVI